MIDFKGIHDRRLLAIVALLLFIDLIFLISWQIFDPIDRQLIYDVSYRSKVFHLNKFNFIQTIFFLV
jgi:hypothetical protein